MPLYDYRCTNCEHTFSKFHNFDNRHKPENEPCPECNHESVKYIMSAPIIGYFNKGSMKTTSSFNDRLKDIKKSLPEQFKGSLNDVIR